MFKQALWLAGFRPFFLLAFVAAVALPLLWAPAFAGHVVLPGGLAPMQWHAHEMLFGFGFAVLGGFLLTASKNWVGVRGIHGGPLVLAVALWLAERALVLQPLDVLRSVPGLVLANACVAYVVGYVIFTLVRHRAKDTFRDNWLFVLALPLLLVSKNLLLTPDRWPLGAALAIGVFRLAFAVMFERTIPQFMKGAGLEVTRRPRLDLAAKLAVLAAAFAPLLPGPAAAAVLGLAAVLLVARAWGWRPLDAVKRFELGIMYAGYLGLVIHFALAALAASGALAAVGTVATHAFTLLCMGLVIPPMLIRICQGHTGRKILFTRSDRLALALMAAAGFLRLVAPQLWPDAYTTLVAASAAGWAACFALVGLRVGRFVFFPRVDGKIH